MSWYWSELPSPAGATRSGLARAGRLGLSVIPDWERALRASLELLRPGGSYLILDVFAERRVPQTALVELVARASYERDVVHAGLPHVFHRLTR